MGYTFKVKIFFPDYLESKNWLEPHWLKCSENIAWMPILVIHNLIINWKKAFAFSYYEIHRDLHKKHILYKNTMIIYRQR